MVTPPTTRSSYSLSSTRGSRSCHVFARSQVIVAGHLYVARLLRDQQELAGLRVGAQQEPELTEDRHVERLPPEEVRVEVGDLLAARLEAADRKRELHVVEARGHGRAG